MPLNRRESGGTVAVRRLFPGELTPMGAILNPMTHRAGRFGLAIFAAAAIAWPALTVPAAARGPDNIADVAEAVIDAVVNISTKQTVDMSNNAMPQLPPGSPFEEFFDEFFKNRRGQGGPRRRPDAAPGQFARLRLHHRRGRPRRDQQPRHRRRRRDQRHPQRRHHAESRNRRPRHQDRSRAAAGQAGQAAQGGEVRRLATNCGWANG